MKGNNMLALNTATIIEAVQEYLDKRLTSNARVRVTDVSQDSSYGSATYVVRVTDEQELQS